MAGANEQAAHAEGIRERVERLGLDEAALRRLLYLLKLCRHVDRRLASLHAQGWLAQPVPSGQGWEGIHVGVAFALRPDDPLFVTHRDLSAQLAKGMDLPKLMAELWGRADGLSGGRAGGTHIVDWQGARTFAVHSEQAVTYPLACGAALASRRLGLDRVAVAMCGAGATSDGRWHQAVGFAARSTLPAVWIVRSEGAEAERPHPAGTPTFTVDGSDVLEVSEAARRAVERARRGDGPSLIEAVASDADDPVERFELLSRELGSISPAQVSRLESEIKRAFDQAYDFAQRSPLPEADETLDGARPADAARKKPTGTHQPRLGDAPEVTFQEAIAGALRGEMERDDRVILMGSEVTRRGGGLNVTEGLEGRFEPGRIFETARFEQALVGFAVGAAMEGLRPVVELHHPEGWLAALADLVTLVSPRYVSGLSIPVVFRGPTGAVLRGSNLHPTSVESLLSQIPGLKVVAPALPADAAGLLRSAIRDEEPSVFLEHRWLYRRVRGHVPDDPEFLTPIGQAEVKREGTDVTVIACGAMVHRALEAADELAGGGVSVEVLDLRTVQPPDREAILRSIERTTRALVVSETPGGCGVASSVAALIAEHGFGLLDGPVLRIAPPDVPIPFSASLQDAYLPQVEDIVEGVGKLMNW